MDFNLLKNPLEWSCTSKGREVIFKIRRQDGFGKGEVDRYDIVFYGNFKNHSGYGYTFFIRDSIELYPCGFSILIILPATIPENGSLIYKHLMFSELAAKRRAGYINEAMTAFNEFLIEKT